VKSGTAARIEKPALRGVIHAAAAWCALGAGSVLVAVAPTSRAQIAVAVFTLSLIELFAVSAIYHRVNWIGVNSRAIMRRLDHASIFVLIAGTYTPVAVLGIGGVNGQRLLIAVWSGALVGVLVSVFWVKRPKAVSAALAVAVGWTMVPFLGEARRHLGGDLWLILAGGVAYTAGAVIYAIRRPNPWPRVFGYHELFHALTVLGAFLHFVAIIHITVCPP
jgi:hemolysin III